MKKLISFVCILSTFVSAKPSYPIHHGVGAIIKGPNSATIIKGPDGSVITAETGGGAIAVDGHNSLVEAAAASAAAAHSITAHQIIDQSAIAASAAQSLSLSQAPIVVEDAIAPIAVAQPVVVAHEPILVGRAPDTAALEGPSGSIITQGENAIISGPSSTTIREGNVIASVKKPELSSIIVEPAQTLIGPAAALVAAPVGISHGAAVAAEIANVAEINAQIANANLINEANVAAAQIVEANRAAALHGIAANINAATIAEANRAAIAHSQQEAIAQANLEAQVRADLEAQAQLAAQARANAEAQAQLEAQARASLQAQATIEAQARANLQAQANLEAQLAHAVLAPQVGLSNVDAANAALLAQSQESLAAQANLNAQLAHAVTPQIAIADVNAALAQSQDAIARANFEAQLAAERNAIATGRVVSLRPGLNPIITQGNKIISDAIIASTPAPVVEVTPTFSSIGPIVSTPNVIVSSTGLPIIAQPVVGPVAAIDGGQVVYQSSSSSSSSQAQSHSSSSSQSSSVNIVDGGLGGVVGNVVPIPVGVHSSDYAQWQESFSKSGHSANEAAYARKVHGGRFVH